MRQEVINVAANVEDIEEGLSSLRVSYESLTRGHERDITSMQNIKDSMMHGFAALNNDVKHLVLTRVNSSNKPVDNPELMSTIDDVRRGFKDTLVTRIGSTTRSTHVLGNTKDTWSDAVAVVQGIVAVDKDTATYWLLRTIHIPSRKRLLELVSMRTSVPILRAKPHFLQQVKEIILAAWYAAVVVSRAELSKEDAGLLLQVESYALSARGWGGIVAAMDVLFRLVHAVDRIHGPHVGSDESKVANSAVYHRPTAHRPTTPSYDGGRSGGDTLHCWPLCSRRFLCALGARGAGGAAPTSSQWCG